MRSVGVYACTVFFLSTAVFAADTANTPIPVGRCAPAASCNISLKTRTAQSSRTQNPSTLSGRPRLTSIDHAASIDSAQALASRGLGSAPSAPNTAPESADTQVTIYGRAGSFGELEGGSSYPSTGLEAIDGWGFLPGQAAYFVAVDAKGRVLIANEPQTSIQTSPTAATMAVSVFDPTSKRFDNVVIPTSTGSLSAVAIDGSGIGGADIGDLQVIDGPLGQQVILTSVAPYNGWDVARTGIYPALAVLNDAADTWVPGKQFTASHLRESSASGAALCDRDLLAVPHFVVDCWGLNEIGLLPRSQLLVATHYFSDPSDDQKNGGLAVLSPEGTVVAELDYPAVVLGQRHLKVHPREIDVDPTSSLGDERFLVVFDVDSSGGDVTQFVAQEFRFDNVSATISPVSAPFTTGGMVNGVPAGVETAGYDHDGNLWIAEARSVSLDGGRLVRYSPAGARAAFATSCAATPGAISAGWGKSCPPDLVIDATTGRGLVRSLTEDVARHRMIAVTIGGSVIVASASGGRVALELPLNQLVDRTRYPIGPRKGATDPDRSTLWVPIEQLRTTAECTDHQCPPAPLDQWLAAIHLSSI